MDKSQALIDRALQDEKFDTAEDLCQIALGAARQLDDRTRQSELERQQNLIEEARKAYKTIHRLIASLEDFEDPQANLQAGRYYCLIRGEWEKGLPMLAKGSHPRLKDLAEFELRNPIKREQQVELADGWWEMSGDDSTRQKVLRLRAAHWYLRALNGLPQGLLRVKAEIRVQQVERDYGKEAVAALEKALTG